MSNSPSVYLINFQFSSPGGPGFGTTQMSFDAPIRREHFADIQEQIREHFGYPTAVITAFSRFET